ncbi:MAG: hypothetical protein NVS4B5_07580 [Vulcanimicrobiaceae bacterium]
MSVSRKDFLAANAAAGATAFIASEAPRAVSAAGAPAPSQLAFDPHDPNIVYDLVVAGGNVLDPSQKLDAKRDVAMKNGQIAALLAPGTAVKSAQTIDASGDLVTPGLVDMHCHYYHQVSGLGLPADEMMHLTMTTTGVDAGDAGYSTFSGFRHFVIGQARPRTWRSFVSSTVRPRSSIRTNIVSRATATSNRSRSSRAADRTGSPFPIHSRTRNDVHASWLG